MDYRRCGNSGLILPVLSLGLWHNFGDCDDQDMARSLMRHAFDAGITHFDLANNYGPPPGSAERNFGIILSSDFAAHRDEMVITTKAGHAMWPGHYGEWGSRKHVLASLDQSLKRLNIPYVDVFYSHRPDPHTPLEETMSALATAVQSGRALYIGLSKYPLPTLQQAVEMLQQMGMRTLIVQPPYSLLNRWPEATGIHDWTHQQGIGSAVFSPLAQGMLSDKYLNRIPSESRAGREEGFLRVENVEHERARLHEFQLVAHRAGMSMSHLALRWVLQQQGVTTAIIGARNIDQLQDNLAVIGQPDISSEICAALDAIFPLNPHLPAEP